MPQANSGNRGTSSTEDSRLPDISNTPGSSIADSSGKSSAGSSDMKTGISAGSSGKHGSGIESEPAMVFRELQDSSAFRGWEKMHPGTFCSHCFCRIEKPLLQPGQPERQPEPRLEGQPRLEEQPAEQSEAQPRENSPWEIGFFHDGRITIFAEQQLKMEDEIFKREDEPVEPLQWEKVISTWRQALENCNRLIWEKYPGQVQGGGFVILQTIKGSTIWNVSFITKALQFLNVKVDAASGEVASHEIIPLLQQ